MWTRRISLVSAVALVLGGLTLAGTPSAGAAEHPRAARQRPPVTGMGLRHLEPPREVKWTPHPLSAQILRDWLATPAGRAQLRTSAAVAQAQSPAAGTKRMWPVFDYDTSQTYLKEFTLRAVGRSIEVWVASGPAPDGIVGTDLRPGDCRTKLPDYSAPTDAQIRGLIGQYDRRIRHPRDEVQSQRPALRRAVELPHRLG